MSIWDASGNQTMGPATSVGRWLTSFYISRLPPPAGGGSSGGGTFYGPEDVVYGPSTSSTLSCSGSVTVTGASTGQPEFVSDAIVFDRCNTLTGYFSGENFLWTLSRLDTDDLWSDFQVVVITV